MPGIEIKGRSKIANYRHGGRTRKFGGGRTNLLEELGRVEAEPSNRNRRAEISRVHGELNRGYAAGGVVKGGIKAGKRFLDFIKTGKHVDKKGVKTNVPKAAERLTGKPHVDRVKKAAGGWTKVLPKGPRGGHPGFTKESMYERWGGGEKGKPHSSKEGRIAGGERNMRRQRERMKERLKKWKEDNPPRAKLPSPKWSDMPRRPLEKPKWSDMPRKPLEKPKYQPLKKGGKADKKWIQKAVNPKHKGYCTPMTKKTCTPARKALARTFKKKAKTGW